MAKPGSRKRSFIGEPLDISTLHLWLLDYLKDYWKWIAAVLAVVIISLGTWGITTQLRAHRAGQAEAAMAKITPELSNPQAAGTALKALDQLLKDYPGTPTALVAAIFRAHLLYQTQKYGDAAKAYEALLQDHLPGWDPVIAESLSYCYEAQGDYRKAAQALQPVVEKATRPLQNEMYRRLAMLLEQAGEWKEAAQYWQKLLDKVPDPALLAYFREKAATAAAAAQKKK
jgi:lipopolysaccharide biosynthesis regulator YciM